MADFALNFVTSTAQTLNGSESGVITVNGGIYSNGADAVTATTGTNWLTNNGLLWAYGGGFAAVDADGSVFELLNGHDGLISAENPVGGTLDFDLTTHADVVNHGSIHSSNNYAIAFSAADTSANFFLTNTGEITAQYDDTVYVSLGTGFTYIVNEGSITATSAALDINGSSTASTFQTIQNHGTITSRQGRAIEVDVGDSGIAYLLNTGTISGITGAFATNRDTDVRIVNTGLMSALNPVSHAISLGGGDDVITNQGQIMGFVYMYDGADHFSNLDGGTTSSAVYAGAGNDTMIGGASEDAFFGDTNDDYLVGRDGADELNGGAGEDVIRGGGGDDALDGSSGFDELHGGSGHDVIYGGSDADSIFGDSGDDTIEGGSEDDEISGGSGEDDIRGGTEDDEISGGSGNDILRGESGADDIGGGAGEDTLSGSSGDDSLDGGSGNDRMFGGADDDTLEGSLGDDYLNGGTGDDSLRGGSHDDTLIGGDGQDTMSGGNGADVFVFSSIDESPHSVSRDLITDFEAGVDKIDLSGFGGLTYVANYTGTAGEVRYNDSVGRLYIDTDGNMASDFSVDLTSGAGLGAGDLIL